MSPDVTRAVRLAVQSRGVPTPRPVVDPDRPSAAPRPLPVLRVVATLQVVSRDLRTRFPGLQSGLLDTGADLSVIEHDTWKPYEAAGLVEPVPFADGTDLADLHIGGGTLRYRLGRVWVRVISERPLSCLPPVPVLARLLEPARKKAATLVAAYPFVLGLHRGILDGRRLTRVPVPPQPTDLRGDCGPEFGQRWFLEDPAGLQPLG